MMRNDTPNQDDQQTESQQADSRGSESLRQTLTPFRKAILRGLAIIMPPLLTLVLFLWAGNIILNNILRPVESTARQLIVWVRGDIRKTDWVQKQLKDAPGQTTMTTDADGNNLFIHTKAKDGQTRVNQWVQVGKSWIRKEVYDTVQANPGLKLPVTAESYCHRYVQLRYLKPQFTIPLFLALFILILYFVGKFLAGGVGRMIWSWTESLINRIPLISNVYSSVKQVTDFALSENEIEFTRVVAVEYPRRGIWSIGFVTGESMGDIGGASGEPMLSVLMPTSPMPATGFTISVPKSQAIDLNISVDQAIQFVVSCGVVVPNHQIPATTENQASHSGNWPDGLTIDGLTESDGLQISDGESA